MLKYVFPILALVLGLASGGTAAVFLSKSDDSAASEALGASPTDQTVAKGTAEDAQQESGSLEIVKLPSQFVVPVIIDTRVRAMVILTVALEVEAGRGDLVRSLEPKLRDEFLSELFGLAALDGFNDEIITRQTLELVKRALSQRSKDVLGVQNVNVLITDMARQDTF